MKQGIRENGSLEQTLEMVEDFRSGQMAHCMRDTGKIARQMEKVDLFTLMVMFMRVCGKMIKLMAMEFTCMLTVPDMKVNGKKTSNTERESRDGQMERCTMESTSKVRNTVEELFSGVTTQFSLESSRTTTSRVTELINGTTGESTTVIGKTTRCMVKVFSHGQTAENTQAPTKKT